MMNNLMFLIKLTDDDKRLIAALLLFLILLFIAVGYLVVLIQKVMKLQGDYIDKTMHDMVITKVITDSKKFKKIAFYKSRQKLFLNARIPAILLMAAGILTLIFFIISISGTSYHLDLFEFNNGTKNQGGSGFTTLFFLWDYNSPTPGSTSSFHFFGNKIIIEYPPLLNSPHLSVEAIPSYIIALLILVGTIWFLVEVQAYLARTIRIFKLSKSIYHKSLTDFNASKNTFDNNESNASNETTNKE